MCDHGPIARRVDHYGEDYGGSAQDSVTPCENLVPMKSRISISGSQGSGRHAIAAALGGDISILDFGASFDHDLLIMVASAAQGIDAEAAHLWELAAERGVPRLLVISQLDIGRTDDDEMRLIAERILGEELLPYTLPLADDDEELAGTLTLTSMVIRDEHAGSTRAADDEHVAIAADTRERLIEAVLANTDNEVLVRNAMLGLSMSPEALEDELLHLVRQGVVALSLPVIAVSVDGRPAVGVSELAELLRRL